MYGKADETLNLLSIQCIYKNRVECDVNKKKDGLVCIKDQNI